jgi:hypothetical protein
MRISHQVNKATSTVPIFVPMILREMDPERSLDIVEQLDEDAKADAA